MGLSRRRSVQSVVEEFQETKRRHMRDDISPDREETFLLWNVVNRYYPEKGRPAGARAITLFLSHANGFSKEVSSVTFLNTKECI